jgi:Fe-Mn family superoxide dismutase
MFTLEKLPYSINALEPYISEETIRHHYGKHHQGYVDKLNKLLLTDHHKSQMTLEELILHEKKDSEIYNQASQVWNHNFFWKCLKPSGCKFSGKIADLIKTQWGTLDQFQEEFEKKSLDHFGSGYTWLILRNKKLEIKNTHDGETPLNQNGKPLLTLDLWEHAYYLDHRSVRSNYIQSFWKIANWGFVNEQLEKE